MKQWMPRRTQVRLGIYGEKAVTLIDRAVIGSSVIPPVYVKQLSDGEVVLELLSDAYGTVQDLKSKLIRRIAFIGRKHLYSDSNNSSLDEAVMHLQLAELLKDPDTAEDDFGFRGTPRDVLKTSAIEAIQNEISLVQKEAENAIMQIARDRDEKIEKLKAKLAELTA